MLLSIITHHRNDYGGYFGNSLWRMQTCINKWGNNFAELGFDDVEISVCDWGSQTPLIDALKFNDEVLKRLNYIPVEPAIAKEANKDSEYSAVHATNVAARNSSGKYFLYLDIDVFFQLDTLKLLIDALKLGKIGDDDLATTFFWGSRRHVPKNFNDTTPTIAEIDEHINNNWQILVHDTIDKNNFMGAATALLVTQEMWYAVGGVDERLRYWGVSDLDIDARLKMKYKFGGDLEECGMHYYHLEHYQNRTMAIENPRRANVFNKPTTHKVNDENWGLVDKAIKPTRFQTLANGLDLNIEESSEVSSLYNIVDPLGSNENGIDKQPISDNC